MPSTEPCVLIVDDEEDTCRNLQDILTDMGYRADYACNARSALELVQQKAYDVALLDLKMPDVDGLTLYHEIKKLRADTVAIVVTAYASADAARNAAQAGAFQVVPKPVEIPNLMGLIDSALEQPLLLVVDDDHDLCANLWDLLRLKNFRVALAHNVQEAARCLNDRQFRVVITDMKLGSESGRQVLQLVREQAPATQTVLITGYRDELASLVDQAIADGASAVCYKPFDIPHLLECIQNLSVHSP